MRTAQVVAVAAIGIVLVAGLIPALAQSSTMMPVGMMPGAGTGMDGHHRGMSGMMSGGCAGMMQSMNGGGGRPNSQWRTHPPGDGSMVN